MLRMRMGRVLALTAAGLLPAALQGCGAAAIQIPTLMTYDGYQGLRPDTERAVKPLMLDHFVQPKPIALECTGGRCTFGGTSLPANLNDKQARNFVQNELLRRSDQICSMQISRMLYGHTIGNTGAKVIKSFVGAVNAVTKPAESIVDAMFEDSSLALGDAEILKWKAFSDTAARIEKSRGVMRNNLRQAQSLEPADYDASQAIYDAERYHELCSFSNAYSAGEQVETTANTMIIVPAKVPAPKPAQSAATP